MADRTTGDSEGTMGLFTPRTSSLPRSRRLAASVAALATLVALGAVGSASAAARPRLAESATRAATDLDPFTLVSKDFRDGRRLPLWTEYGGVDAAEAGCFGKNLAPELSWSNVPSGTQGFALLVNDMDAPSAGGWHHYVVYDIPGNVTELPGHGVHLYTEGATSWDTNGIPNVGWGGPCPPADGSTHHYIFTLYALSTATLPGSDLTYEQVISAINPYVLGATVIIGTFSLPLQH
jgi:Raf kinase inhibitor-like YbhB/YbcL family protein